MNNTKTNGGEKLQTLVGKSEASELEYLNNLTGRLLFSLPF